MMRRIVTVKNFKVLLIAAIIFCLTSESIFSQQQIKWFSVTHRIVGDEARTGPLQDASFIPYIMTELNKAFLPAGIQFVMSCVGIDTINNFYFSNYFFIYDDF